MRKHATRFTAMAMAAVLTCSGIVFSNDNVVFAKTDTITSNTGSCDVTGLSVPTLAYDDNSITVVWDKPENYANISDYNVYINGKKAGTARESFKENADWASAYMEAFYAGYEEKDIDMVDVDIHSYKATNLEAGTEYTFEVRAVDEDGNELGTSNIITQSTTAKQEVFDITDYGAKTSEGYTTYDDEINAFIEANTKAIQAAIDDCSEGGKVVVPAGTFVTGAIYLKSNMTLELQEGAILWGSPNADHYESNYLLYPYSTDTRSWALISAYSSDENQLYENIRITGEGTIYGNGWKYGKKTTVLGDGTSEVQYQTVDALDPADDMYKLEQWVGGSKTTVGTLGVLAADAANKAAANGSDATTAYATRPNLVALRGVDGIYIEGITVKNPAFHTIALLDSKNVVSNNVKYITYDCNNADGIEIGNTENALIFNNFFDTGDDSINFATGLGNGVNDTKQQASSNIWTFNNFIRNGHGGAIAAGSHTGAGICNMLVEDNVINLNEMPFRFKSAPINGGGIFNITIRDCAVANCKQLVTMSTSYGDANQAFSVEPADSPAEFYNISAYNITADGISKNTFSLIADVSELYKPWHTHHNLYFQDITCTNVSVQNSEVIQGCEDVEFNNVDISWTSKISSPTPWSTITDSKNITFTGTTTVSGSPYATNAMTAPSFAADANVSAETAVKEAASYNTATATLSWDAATDDTSVEQYSIDVYVGDKKVDQINGITTTSYEVTGLSTGVEYTFKVFASDATGNRTEGPNVTVTTAGGTDTTAIVTPASADLSFSGIGYTWGLATFASARVNDERVRGYDVYVNGEYKETFYNYKVKDSTTGAEISQNVRRLVAGEDNKVTIVAFTDAGIAYEYNEATVTTTENYDYKAPEWGEDAYLNVTTEGDDVILSWSQPTDESGILGYRVYVDGKAVTGSEDVTFNEVNGAYTTAETTYTVSGLDLTKDHTFKVEAADSWWKALEGTGPYHWTLSGPTASYTAASEVIPSEEPTPTETPEQDPVVTPSEEPAPTTEPEVTPTLAPTTEPTTAPVTVNAVKNFKVSSITATTASLSWSKSSDATGYQLTYKNAAGKTVTKTLSAKTASYKVSGLKPETSYSFTIKAYKKTNGNTVTSKAVSVKGKTKQLAKVTGVKTQERTQTAVRISWNKTSECSGYEISYKNALGKTVKVTLNSSSKTTKEIGGLLANTTYKFSIRPYVTVNGKKVYGDAVTKTVKTKKVVKPAKTTIKSVKAGKTSIQVSYKSVDNAAGYDVYYSKSKTSGFKKVSAASATKTTIKSLKSNTTYYVKVRAYTVENKVVNGKVVKTKVYGAFSNLKKVTL